MVTAMGDLAVTVRLNGFIVEDRVLPVHRLVRIGEAEDAEVAFPGADVTVVRMGDRLALRSRTLEEGEEMHISLGHLEITVEHTMQASLPSEWRGLADHRFLAAAVMVTLGGAWMDAAELWLDRQSSVASPAVVAQAQGVLDALRDGDSLETTASVSGGSEARRAAPEAPVVTEGPRHTSDDARTGMGYASWLIRSLPPDDASQSFEDRLDMNPGDATARLAVARTAYENEDYDLAAWHYSQVVERYPGDRATRVRLAWSEKRRGRHSAEIEHYREVLEVDPTNPTALGGVAVALARLKRLDEASDAVDELQAIAPMDPMTDMALASMHALQGHDDDALIALNRAFEERGQLSEELRLELQRDIAMDPAFATLRRDLRLRSLLHRHLGAAAPRPYQPERRGRR